MPSPTSVRVAALVLVAVGAALPALPAAAPDDPTLPAEALLLRLANRARRTAVPTDPVQAQIVAGTWSAPKPGTAVRLPDGSERTWQAVPLKDGRLELSGPVGGYVYVPVTAV